MCGVTPTDFSTPCLASCQLRRAAVAAWRWACLLWLGAAVSVAWAQSSPPTSSKVATQVQRTTEGLFVSARVPIEATDGMQDVLLRGVPLQFVWQADIKRSRWYWTDVSVKETRRVIRVAYQPLTRRWRVSVLGDPNDQGLGNALHRNVDTLQEALRTAQVLAQWQLLTPSELPSDSIYVNLSLRVDANLLPRTFQGGGDGGLIWRGRLGVLDTVERMNEPQWITHEEPRS
jgi:hypothetical protein